MNESCLTQKQRGLLHQRNFIAFVINTFVFYTLFVGHDFFFLNHLFFGHTHTYTHKDTPTARPFEAVQSHHVFLESPAK